MPYQACVPQQCSALLVMPDDLKQELTKSQKGTITVYALNGQGVQAVAELTGFSDGLAALDKRRPKPTLTPSTLLGDVGALSHVGPSMKERQGRRATRAALRRLYHRDAHGDILHWIKSTALCARCSMRTSSRRRQSADGRRPRQSRDAHAH
jgi:hypothetical protein